MGLSDGRKSFPIGLAVLIQYRSVAASQPASQPRRCTYYAQRQGVEPKNIQLEPQGSCGLCIPVAPCRYFSLLNRSKERSVHLTLTFRCIQCRLALEITEFSIMLYKPHFVLLSTLLLSLLLVLLPHDFVWFFHEFLRLFGLLGFNRKYIGQLNT